MAKGIWQRSAKVREKAMHRKEQHKRAEGFCRTAADCVEQGMGDEVCKEKLLIAFDELVQEVFRPDNVHTFRFYPNRGIGTATYGALLAKARQVRAIVGSHPPAREEPDDEDEGQGSFRSAVTTFLTTFSSASMVFMVAAHFTATVPPSVRSMFGA
jgi:hypothetical protein